MEKSVEERKDQSSFQIQQVFQKQLKGEKQIIK